MAYCEVAGCERPALGGGLCSDHRARQRRWDLSGGRSVPVAAPIVPKAKTPRERLHEAALHLADVESEPHGEGAFRAAQRRHWEAAIAFACSGCVHCRTPASNQQENSEP